MSTNTNTNNAIENKPTPEPATPLSTNDQKITSTASTVEKTGTTCCGFCDSKNSAQ